MAVVLVGVVIDALVELNSDMGYECSYSGRSIGDMGYECSYSGRSIGDMEDLGVNNKD